MKTIRHVIFAILIIAAKSLFAQADNNYVFRSLQPGFTGFNNFYFGDATGTTSGVFIHDGSMQLPSMATIGTGLKYSSGALQIDLLTFSTVALSGDYNDLINRPSTRTFNNTASHTVQTTAAAGNGVQLSITRDASVSYSLALTTTANISGNAAGYAILQICSTNSATAGNWVEIARVSNSQTLTLAITLQSVQVSGSPLSGIVPAGYYSRVLFVNTSNCTCSANATGQEVLL